MKTAVLLACFIISTPLFGQEANYRHAVTLEISKLGTLGFAGLFGRYDYMFKRSSLGFLDASASVGGYYFGSTGDGLAIRQAITYNLGSKRHFFEGGLAWGYYHEYYTGDLPHVHEGFFWGPQIGYKSISRKGFQFRIFAATYLGADTNYSLGIGFGKAFGKINTTP